MDSLSKVCHNVYNSLVTFLAPPFCSYCKKFLKNKSIFCNNCKDLIRPIVSTTISITKKHSIKVFSVSNYKEPMRSLILSKHSSDIISSRYLGCLIWDLTYIKNMEFDYIVPIPLHWRRFAKRGFNQAQEIAHVISKRSGKKVVYLLKRIKNTKYQAELTAEKRIDNLQKAFSLSVNDLSKYKGKRFLLVDDLMTTGSTLKTASRLLLSLKPISVCAVVACRVV